MNQNKEISANDKLKKEIIDLEWEMFSTVENQGGKAICQSRPETFTIMRDSQLETWNTEILLSYRSDLLQAKAKGRNLCSEKYGYMMASTVPDEYEKIRHLLPAIEPEKQEMIDEIVSVNLVWEQDVDQRYPKLRKQGRPLKKELDTPEFTSVETYLSGELQTYSLQTIRLLREYTLYCKEQGTNLAEENLKNIIRSYGYHSLDEAESQM